MIKMIVVKSIVHLSRSNYTAIPVAGTRQFTDISRSPSRPTLYRISFGLHEVAGDVDGCCNGSMGP
jgi:hypothetical protein